MEKENEERVDVVLDSKKVHGRKGARVLGEKLPIPISYQGSGKIF